MHEHQSRNPEPKLLAAWLMANDMRPLVGHGFTFKAEPMPWWDGIVRCEVLELDLHKRLRGWERMIGQGLIEVLAREAGGTE